MDLCGNETIIDCKSARLNAELLSKMVRYETARHLHSLIVLRHGVTALRVSARPFRADVPSDCYSMGKSFVSLAVGIAESEGRLSIDSSISEFFSEYDGQTSSEAGRLTVRQLLTMTTGMRMDAIQRLWAEDDWIAAFLATPLSDTPGTRFEYNNFASFMLSAIIQRVTGARLNEYLRDRVFDKAGIGPTFWEDLGKGADWGASGLYIAPNDVARFGQLLLANRSNGRQQFVPNEYLERATSMQVESHAPDPQWTECFQGYGYHFWLNSFGGYRASGMLGNELVVVPEYDLVVALCGSLTDSGIEELDVVPNYIIPACHEGYAGSNNALSEAARELEDGLMWARSDQAKTPPVVPSGVFVLERPIERGPIFNVRCRHEAFSFAFHENESRIAVSDSGRVTELLCGMDGEYRVNDNLYRIGERDIDGKIALIGEWVDQNVFHFEMRPLSARMWIVYWIEFVDAETIVVNTYTDARSYADGRYEHKISVRGYLSSSGL